MIRSREWPWRGRACPSLRVRTMRGDMSQAHCRHSEHSEESRPFASLRVTRVEELLEPIGVRCLPSMHDVKQLESVMRYHEETKHHFNRYARALGYLDWAN